MTGPRFMDMSPEQLAAEWRAAKGALDSVTATGALALAAGNIGARKGAARRTGAALERLDLIANCARKRGVNLRAVAL